MTSKIHLSTNRHHGMASAHRNYRPLSGHVASYRASAAPIHAHSHKAAALAASAKAKLAPSYVANSSAALSAKACNAEASSVATAATAADAAAERNSQSAKAYYHCGGSHAPSKAFRIAKTYMTRASTPLFKRKHVNFLQRGESMRQCMSRLARQYREQRDYISYEADKLQETSPCKRAHGVFKQDYNKAHSLTERQRMLNEEAQYLTPAMTVYELGNEQEHAKALAGGGSCGEAKCGYAVDADDCCAVTVFEDAVPSPMRFESEPESGIDVLELLRALKLAALGLCFSAFMVGLMPMGLGDAHADSALDDIIALGGEQNTLSKQDLEILRALEASSKPGGRRSGVARPVVERPGEVRFVYGAGRPTVVCSLLHVCDIALEPGETVVDVQSGDAARWVLGRSAHGTPLGMVEHVTIKPTDIGLESNLTIYTDKRSYSMDIKSSAKDFMPSVSFIYTEQSMERYQQVKDELMRRQRYNTLSLNGDGMDGLDAADDYVMSEAAALPRGVKAGRGGVAMLSGLDFDYKISGDKEVIPLRVFNDGKHTYIQMPQKLLEGMLPALVEVTETHVFSDDATAVTNYRINGNNFVVDGIPRHLRLFIGNSDSGRAMSADIIRNS